ncbi:MAG: M23 family metallopeptidase [Rikenellaceae bacterium]|jgi:murein DD-endopeptidase MepM/ murein hydrolase activator NlpD|nr:M23 family metallopeptidase [Rikenellaceae bacterium]
MGKREDIRSGRRERHPVHFRRKLVRFGVHFFAGLGFVVFYYFAFSFFVDTPLESEMKRSNRRMADEYRTLTLRYDTLERVLDNVADRDRYIFRTLFDSDPFRNDQFQQRLMRYDTLLRQTNRELGGRFADRTAYLENRARQLGEDLALLQKRIVVRGQMLNHIPSIQPVINNDLTRLATSYGMRIHPFYKTLAMHQGVDYVVPQETRVFATADGTVARVQTAAATGLSITLSHGNGYETAYNHLDKALVHEGDRVRRGEIIASSGDTGLSLAPHLHYEVRLRGMRVDPIHYFFNELGPDRYDRVRQLAAVGMQSFD